MMFADHVDLVGENLQVLEDKLEYEEEGYRKETCVKGSRGGVRLDGQFSNWVDKFEYLDSVV